MKVAVVGTQNQRAIGRVLGACNHSLIWSATSASEALKRCESAAPDVLLVTVPPIDMTAAALTRAALARHRCAVLLLADSGTERVSQVYDAMGAGALDVVAPPLLDDQGQVTGGDTLLAKLRTAARLLGQGSQQFLAVSPRAAVPAQTALVAIGASTGGPQALLSILSALPRDFAAAIVIIQHVDSEFSEGLASWLRDSSDLRVDVAREGDTPKAGAALIAGSSDHLVMMSSGTLRYRAEPVNMPYRPSVDVFFSSLAEHWPVPGHAVLLTGMGRDGAEGMKKLRLLGWHTIAQDEASSVVYGMPKAAAAIGAACKVLAPPAIAKELVQQLARH